MRISRILSRKVWLPFLTHLPRRFNCEICQRVRLLVRTDVDPSVGARCLSCRGTVFHRSMFKVICEIFGPQLERLHNGSVYEISAHGALYNALKRRADVAHYSFTGSELLDGWQPGAVYGGIRCENVESLTFADRSFDLVTSSGLMEHVEDDVAAYTEIRRVLKPGGWYVFTVPLSPDQPTTLVRAKRQMDGSVKHFAEPEYHSDPFRGEGGVFTWRNYGSDLLGVLKTAGLSASLKKVEVAGYEGEFPVIVARRNDDATDGAGRP